MKNSTNQYEYLYIRLKKQYDSLIEKNQNDLVKIRAKQKMLNEKIALIQRERQEEVEQLKRQIEKLQNLIKTGKQNDQQLYKEQNNKEICLIRKELTAKEMYIKEIQEKLKDIEERNSILQRQIGQLNKKQKTYQKQMNDVRIINKQMQQQLKKLSNIKEQMQKLKKSFDQTKQQLTQSKSIQEIIYKQKQTLKQQLFNLSELNNKLHSNNDQLIQKMNKFYKQNECISKQLNKYQIILNLKEKEYGELQQQLQEQKRKSGLKDEVECSKCIEYAQQLELHKQMLKSVRMMLKFKQLQLQNKK